MLIKNLLDHPTDPDGEPFWFPELDPAGLRRGRTSGPRRRTCYNPRRDAAQVVGAWIGAGGELATDEIPSPKHG